MKNIFREDLKLNNRWFHRLFKILFIIGIIILIGEVLIEFREKSINHYRLVDKLENRLNDRVYKIEDLLNYGEKFESHSYGGGKEYGSYGDSELFCSNNISNIDNLRYIINKFGIDNFDRVSKVITKETLINNFSETINDKNIKCILKDQAKIGGLLPTEYFNNFGFYRKNKLDYFFDSFVISNFILEIFGRLFVYLILVYIIYYKIILYIIYGRNKK